MNDELISKAIDAYENEPGVMQFPAMKAAAKVFDEFYKAEIELLRTEAKGLSQSLTDCLECEKDYLEEISSLRAQVEKVRGYEVAPLEAKAAELRAEVERMRNGIEKALSEIEDDGPKALKYAAQELRAAMKEQAE